MKPGKCVDASSDALTAVLLKIISWNGTTVTVVSEDPRVFFICVEQYA